MENVYTSDDRYALMQNYRDILARAGALDECPEKSEVISICHDELDEIRLQGVSEVDYESHYANVEVLISILGDLVTK